VDQLSIDLHLKVPGGPRVSQQVDFDPLRKFVKEKLLGSFCLRVVPSAPAKLNGDLHGLFICGRHLYLASAFFALAL